MGLLNKSQQENIFQDIANRAKDEFSSGDVMTRIPEGGLWGRLTYKRSTPPPSWNNTAPVAPTAGLLSGSKQETVRTAGGMILPTQEQLQNPRIKKIFDEAREAKKIADELDVEPVRASDLPRIPRMAVGVGTGLLGTAEGLLGAAEWAGVDTFKQANDKISEWRADMAPEDADFLDQLSSGLGSASAFFLPGLGISRLTTALNAVSPTMARIIGGTASAFLESSVEAGSVYNDLINEGKSEDQASTAASNDFFANIILTAVTNRLGVFGDDTARTLKRIIMSSGTEALQEFGQQIIANANTGRDWLDGAFESGLIGGIIGGGLAALTPNGVTGELPEIEDVVKDLDKKAKENGVSLGLSIKDVSGDLASEAKKYKSAEEFVTGIENAGDNSLIHPNAGIKTKTGTPVILKGYHGTNKNFDNFVIPQNGVRYTGDGVYFTPSKNAARAWGSNVKEAYLQLDNPYVYYPATTDAQPGTEMIRSILDKGHDSIIVRFGRGTEDDIINEIVVFDTSKIKTKSQLTDIWEKANKQADKVSDDLMTEARKYDSAEEYVKAQAQPLQRAETSKSLTAKLYHGSPDARFAEEFDPTKPGYYPDLPEALPDMKEWEGLYGKPSQGFRSESTTGNKGVSFTDDFQTAKSYSNKPAFDQENSVPMVLERYVTLKNPKVYDLKGKEWNLKMEEELRKALENGHDGLVFKNIRDDYHPFQRSKPTNNVIVLDTNAIKTRSQLTDIWNQANKKGSDLKPQSKQESPKITEADKLIAEGKIRVVSRKGRDVYQYMKNGEWKTAPNEMVAVDRVKGKVKPAEAFPQHIEEMMLTYELKKEALDQNPAKELQKYVPTRGDFKGKLKEVTGKKDGGVFSQRGDDIVTELGYEDSETAREAYEKYVLQRDELKLLEEKIKTTKALYKKAEQLKKQGVTDEVKAIRQIAKSEGEARSLEKVARETQAEMDDVVPSFPSIVEQSATSVKDKIHLLDYMRTPDRVLKKLGLTKEWNKLKTGYYNYAQELPKNLDVITEWSKRVPEESNERIFKYLDGEAIDLNKTEKEVAMEIRKWLVEWADRLNLPEDKRITHYITHIFDKELMTQEFDEDLAKIIGERIPGQVYDPFLEKRLGAKGYKMDTWGALDAYVKRATRKANIDPGIEAIRAKAGDKLEFSPLEESQWNYVKRYIDNVNMRPTNVDNLIDNTVKSVVGYKFGQRPVSFTLGFLRRVSYRAVLGFNAGSALLNLSQGSNTYATLGGKYTMIGYMKLFSDGAMQELTESGALDAGFIEDRVTSALKQKIQKVDKAFYILYEAVERINRGSAYFGAKAKGINEGMTEYEAIEYAKDIVSKTQFRFSSIDRPVALQSDIMRTAFQLQTYTVKQIEFLSEMVQDKNYIGLLRYTVGSLLYVATIGRLFGMRWEQLIPSFRFDTPVSLQFIWELISALGDFPDEYGNDRELEEKVMDVLNSSTTLIPGSAQAKKMLYGAEAVIQGKSTDASGRDKFPVGNTTAEKVQAILFGKYSTKGARDYYDKGKSYAEQEYERIMKSDNKAEEFQKIIDTDPDLANKINRVIWEKEVGFTDKDKEILGLGVKNGERAEAIFKELNKLKTNEEKGALYQDYINKKIITPEVSEQLNKLLSEPTEEGEPMSALQKGINTALGVQTAYAKTAPMKETDPGYGKTYWVRNNEVNENDLEEMRAILWGEVSDRSFEKQKLEAQVIVNTAFNRMDEIRRYHGGKEVSLTDVITSDNQYQAKGGKQYNLYKAGKLDMTKEAVKRRLRAIDTVLSQIRNGTLIENTNGAFYYKHNPDGSITYDDERPLFK